MYVSIALIAPDPELLQPARAAMDKPIHKMSRNKKRLLVNSNSWLDLIYRNFTGIRE
jgi:hypothetical protein